jgi:hypothetical protein
MKNIILFLVASILLHSCKKAPDTKQFRLKVENNIKGAPLTVGVPFPINELHSVDHIRILTSNGKEIARQTTEVSTWGPNNNSIKWVWIFFFSEEEEDYIVEYGSSVSPIQSFDKIISTNNMRPAGGIKVNTGPISFSIDKKGNGFIDQVYMDTNLDQIFQESELIASSPEKDRGTFFDILDPAGIDSSKAVINEVFREKGSGPMHSIFRVEGTYEYQRPDNNNAPFTIYLHAYAGKSYIRVLHTLTYTGIPDMHRIEKGQHANIATQNSDILSENTENDPGWLIPNDQITGVGLNLTYHLDEETKVLTPIDLSNWNSDESSIEFNEITVADQENIRVTQTGPDATGVTSFRDIIYNNKAEKAPLTESKNFKAVFSNGKENLSVNEKSKGWIDISDKNKGISVGIKNFLEEYPKGLEINLNTKTLVGSVWPANVGPKSFERKDTKKDGEMLGNFAQGITKTTEFVYYFHDSISPKKIDTTLDYVINNPVAHAAPSWYTESKVYCNMAPHSSAHPEYENALQYKYKWWAFNQKNQPWYGMFDYGDGKTYYLNNQWAQWVNNEPTVDFMLWTNFMRTGDSESYRLAQAMSRHTMDVDNIHWPKKRTYIGEINDAIDFVNYEEEPESTPYLGIGRRHGNEHWTALLSAHVWIQGWISSYYLSGDHRALQVAKMTGDTYLNRIWGEHDLRGRRLYLSILNLVELYDATKLDKYKVELDQRVNLILEFQERQGGNLLLDRYGYSQTYVAQGLYKYFQITGDLRVKKALIEHARWVRDVPPLNHEMESYLATIYPLLIGYEFSGDIVFYQEALNRAEYLKIGVLPNDPDNYTSVEKFGEDLVSVSNLPKSEKGFTNWETNQGLRVFGWTHANNIPYLLYWIDKNEK